MQTKKQKREKKLVQTKKQKREKKQGDERWRSGRHEELQIYAAQSQSQSRHHAVQRQRPW